MPDLSTYTDDELRAAAGIVQAPSLKSMSDDELMKIAKGDDIGLIPSHSAPVDPVLTPSHESTFKAVRDVAGLAMEKKMRNAETWAYSLNIPKEVAIGLLDPLTKKYGEPNVWEKAQGSFKAGWGDVTVSIGGIMKRKGIDPETAQVLIDGGERLKQAYIPPSDTSEFSWRKLTQPEWYATTAMRSVPFMLSLIPAAVVGAYGGAAAAGAAGFGAFGTTVAGAIGGAALSRPIESAFEAQGAYEEAKQKGMTDFDAERAADKVFFDNMKLIGLDATEFATAFLPMGKVPGRMVKNMMARRVLATGGKLAGVGIMEGAEERYQEKSVMDALGDNVSFFDFSNFRLNEASAAGAVFGVGLGGAGSVFTALKSKVTAAMPDTSKAVYDAARNKAINDGLPENTADIIGLDAVAETPEGKQHIEAVLTDMKNLVEGKEAGPRAEKTVQGAQAKQKGPIILGVNEDSEGVPFSFNMADPETGATFTVDAKAVEGQGEKINYVADPEQIATEIEKARQSKDPFSEMNIDRIIQGDTDIEAEVNTLFQGVMQSEETKRGQETQGAEGLLNQKGGGETRPVSEILKDINAELGERGSFSIQPGDMTKVPALVLELGQSIYSSGVRTFNDFVAAVKQTVGELWAKVEPYLKEAWDMVRSERGSFSTQKKGSLYSEVVKAGGLDPDKLKSNHDWNEDITEYGLTGLTRKGGLALDDLASELQSRGVIGRTPDEFAGPGDYLLQLLKDETTGRDRNSAEAKAEQEYINNIKIDTKTKEQQSKADYQKGYDKGLEEVDQILAETVAVEREKWFSEAEKRASDDIRKALKAAREAHRKEDKVAVLREKARAYAAMEKLNWMNQRRAKVTAIRDFLQLSDEDLRKVNKKNPILMTEQEFHDFAAELYVKAVEFQETRQAKLELLQLIQKKNLQKVDNYRQALGLPVIQDMTAEQLRQFADLLEPFENDDVFLTKRELETVDMSDVLRGVKTWREAREILAKEAGVPIEALDAVKVGKLDSFRWDTALVDQNPWYNVMVRKTVAALLGAQLRNHEIETQVFKLAKKSDKSRDRSITEKLIPQDKRIMEYLEAPADMREVLAKEMTDEQLEYAHFISQYFARALDYLIATKSLERGRSNYFVHIRKTFLENLKDNGLLRAVKDLFSTYEQDAMVFNILDDDTGNILPLQKFFQFSLQRTGYMDPTQNVTRAFLIYVRTFERKVALDAIIPELDIYAQSITPTVYTPRGLEVDRSLKKFLNQYINNKKGRQISYDSVIKQGGPVDMGIRALRTFTTLMDLGLNIPVGVASFVGEQVANIEMIGFKGYALGNQRMQTKQGKAILEKYQEFTDRGFWEKFSEPGKEFTGRLATGLFGLFHVSNVTANKQFLLGSLTQEEWETGELSKERLAELKLEMGRFRVVPGGDSLVGSTSVGGAATQYKGWAIPIMRTLSQDVVKLTKDLKNKSAGEALTTREAKEVYRFIGLCSTVLIVGAMAGGNDKDKSWIGKMKARIYRESLTLMQGVDPKLWLSTPRVLVWLAKVGNDLHSLVILEKYKTKPGLKGVQGLISDFTPSMLRKEKKK